MKITNESYNIFRTASKPRMAEQDFLECNILDQLFQDPFINDNFVFAGGGSITKAYNIGARMGQDLDLACIHFDEVPANRSQNRLLKFKRKFKEYVFRDLRQRIQKIVNQDNQFMIVTDREWGNNILENKEQFLSSPTLHLLYKSAFGTDLGHICIEVIPRKYLPETVLCRNVVPYSIPRPIGQIPTVAYQQTFWDKVHALHSTAINTAPNVSEYFSRHYYDVAQMSAHIDLSESYYLLDNIAQHQKRYTTRNIPEIAAPTDIELIPDAKTLSALGTDYQNMAGAFIGTPDSWDSIVQQLHRLNTQIKTL